MLRSPVATIADDVFQQRVEPELHGRIIHHTASIGKNVSIGSNVRIDAFAILEDGAEIEDNVEIRAHVYVGPMTRIGSGTVLHPHVSVRERVQIGRNVTINCGSVIGSDGFGFTNNSGLNHKIPQVGTVEIEDGVWIGSNVTIDRATIGVTRVKEGARIDNLAQIGHNVEVGRDTIIMPQAGIAGSTIIGVNCHVGEKAGITGHIEIGNNVTIQPFSGITKGLGDGENVMGLPARPIQTEASLQALVGELPNIVKDIQRLKHKLTAEKQ